MAPATLALAALFAAVIGLTLGMIGGGGSILTVPVFVYVLGLPAKQAIAMSLPVVGATSLVGAAGHWRVGNVQWRTALGFGLVAMAGSFGGARLAHLLDGAVQLTLLGAVMLGAAVSMLRSRDEAVPPREGAPRRIALVAGAGLGVGVMTGLVGIGGGFLIVPALVLLVGLPMKRAVGTSLVVITMNAASGFAGYAGTTTIDWRGMGVFTALAIAGVLAGTRLAAHVPARQLKRLFAIFLVAIATFVLYQNRGVFLGTR
ncbi:MAG: sulfite exporter TauE/SafE family protein [Gemmatimonadetes bacterium]|nr:sulfite exporter TauE/SafE family protein [Gemmatimonadota bacterium]